ncbi:MAG: hypothetical protein E7300_12535 [Lachnospiraceae bacterium]|nr:hypothetical protein [Lachnospiraceae bacterium]
MKRQKARDWFWIAIIFVFVLCVVEGFVYYYETDNLFLRVSLNIQNIIKAFKLDPDIKQIQAIEFLKQHQTDGVEGFLLEALTYTYCVAVLIAPFLTMAALFALIRGPYAFLRGMLKSFSNRSRRLLVLGSGEDYEKFLNALSIDHKVTTVVTGALSGDRRISYMEWGIRTRTGFRDGKEWLRKTGELRRFFQVILCDENELNNLEMLKEIIRKKNAEQSRGRDGKHLQVYVCVNDTRWADEIDRLLGDEKQITCTIVNFNENAANRMLMEHPIYKAQVGDKRDVHIGIVGFGEVGQNTLISALNMAVLSADSVIRADVYDSNMKSCLDCFLKRFSAEITDTITCRKCAIYEDREVSEYILTLPSKPYFDMDGIIEIHFWETDVRGAQFKRIFAENNTMPFSYIVLTLGNLYALTSLIMSIKDALGDPEDEPTMIAVASNISMARKEAEGANDTNRRGFYIYHRDQAVYSFDAISNKALNRRVDAFQDSYDVLSAQIAKRKAGENTEPNNSGEKKKPNIYARQSTLYQAMNQETREWIVDLEKQKTDDEKALKEIFSKIEHRRWVVYMITHGWRYADIEAKDPGKKLHPCICTWEDLMRTHSETAEYDYIPYEMILKDKTPQR